eukprot:Sdes_comp20703_c0_seq2m16330
MRSFFAACSHPIPFSFAPFRAGLIQEEELEMIQRYDNKVSRLQADLLEANGSKYIRLLLNLLSKLSKMETIQYLLTLIDDLIAEDEARICIFHQVGSEAGKTPYGPFLKLLKTFSDSYIQYKTSKILTVLLLTGQELAGNDLVFFCGWICSQLKAKEANVILATTESTQRLLRIDAYRIALFQTTNFMETFLEILAQKNINFQIQYQILFCLWLLTFNSQVVADIHKFPLVSCVAILLKQSVREKIVRVSLALLRNLVEKSQNRSENIKTLTASMVNSNIHLILKTVATKKWIDEDILQDLDFLQEKMNLIVQELSSFDQYISEIQSGKLTWSPVHKSDVFWHENAAKFLDNHAEIIQWLLEYIHKSTDIVTLAVAVHDIGEFVRHYPRGKKIIEKLAGKTVIMGLMNHHDSNVRYEALLAVQKLMVHNWEYLGKQFPEDMINSTNLA